MNGGPSGFHHAPVTRTFVTGSALLSLLLGPRGPTLRLGLSYQDIFKKLRNWRLITSNFAFSSTPELLFGVYLLYYFRVFERQIGSNKHSVFILFSVFVSTIFEILALAYLKDATFTLASGPYGLIFASFVPFYFDIPVSSRFRIFSLRLTDKSFIYLAGLQLLFSSWNQSIVPGICGVLAGLLYRLNAFGVRRIKFPDGVAPLLLQISWPSLGSSSSILSNGNPMGSIPSYPGHQVEGNNSSAAFASVTEPLESSIATLVSMGFDRNSARQALVQARNDINVATNILLEMQPR